MRENMLNQLEESWRNLNTIIPFGSGMIANRVIRNFRKDFQIPYVIDNDVKKQGTYIEDALVISFEQAIEQGISAKIVVMTGGRAYGEISRDLQAKGFEENKDFCQVERFISEWNWKYKHSAQILQVNTAITSMCTFRCRNCNMFVPYYKENVCYTLEEMKKNFASFFKYIDYTYSIILLGGEPLLNHDLSELLLYLQENYSDQYGYIGIVTNGSRIPDQKLTEALLKTKTEVNVSDYRGTVPYDKKYNDLIQVLKDNHIPYVEKSSLEWCDFGFPEKPLCISEHEVEGHMHTCAPLFHGLNDSKFYYCHVAWSAEKSGNFVLNQNDYVDLEQSNIEPLLLKEQILNHNLGNLECGYLSFCKVCGGCGIDNTVYVRAGIQKQG